MNAVRHCYKWHCCKFSVPTPRILILRHASRPSYTATSKAFAAVSRACAASRARARPAGKPARPATTEPARRAAKLARPRPAVTMLTHHSLERMELRRLEQVGGRRWSGGGFSGNVNQWEAWPTRQGSGVASPGNTRAPAYEMPQR